jgi:phage/plasmid-associated DNA primase
MTQVAEVRDWLAELRALLEIGDEEGSKSHVVEIAKARPDLKQEVYALAAEYLDEGEAKRLCADAAEVVSAAKAKPGFICSPAQPSVGTGAKAEQEESFKARFQRILAEQEEAEAPKPKVKREPEEAKPEAAAKAKPVAAHKPEPKAPQAVLDPSAPLDIAHEFAKHVCIDGVPTVCYCLTEWWRFSGQVWEKEVRAAPILRKDMWRFLGNARKRDEARFKPKPTDVNAALDALESELLLQRTPTPSMWLDTGEVVPELVVFRNGIVNLLTGELQPLTHKFWAYTGLDFDWDPEAKCPRWELFLEEVFPDDGESQQFIEEFMGYCMTDQLDLEKGAMLISVTRSGKSTIGYLIGQLVGDKAYAGLLLQRLAGG